ncbi:MAG TPA: long-chain fatty aldehyde decarbonylase, partial [Prochlorococcus sp.]
MSKASPQIDNKQIDFSSDAYRDAYSRINGVVVVGEALADRHFRLLAKSIP